MYTYYKKYAKIYRRSKMQLEIQIKNIKNIKEFNYKFEFENGVYAIVGENAVGKSTVMSAIASTVYPDTLLRLGETEISKDSYVFIKCNNVYDKWYYSQEHGSLKSHKPKVVFNGIYEGSVFSGTRFQDMTNIDKLILENPSFIDDFVPARDNLKEAMSIILKNTENKYNELYKLKNMTTVKKYKLLNMPYFYKLPNNKFISKYKMSSGECMLISLLNFINSTALDPERNKNKRKICDDRMFIFIDEVELALHPSSIIRLVEYLKKKMEHYKLTVLFSTHSTELIKLISPKNIFLLENNNGKIEVINPCYPQYAIRSVYDHDGNDCTILVEDKLAMQIVKIATEDFRIKNNLLINYLPVGGWESTLQLQNYISKNSILGRDKFVFSILDGDIMEIANKREDFKNLKKLFLPITSIEKYLYQKLIKNKDFSFCKKMGNKIFTLESLDNILKNFQLNGKGAQDISGKSLYDHLCYKAQSLDINKESFSKLVSELIIENEDFSKLSSQITQFIEDNFIIPQK